MNRYFFYLILVNMLINVFMYVPSILIRERFDGAVAAVLVGTLIGSSFLFIFTRSISKFPKLGAPEIFEDTPKWFYFSFLSFFSIMWYFAGAISLLAFNNITIRFVNPDISGVYMIGSFALLVILILIRLKSDKILYTIEILMVINVPLTVIIMIQAYTNDYLSINSILEVGTHILKVPSWSTVAASSFIFSGYANLVIFNRVFKEKINLKRFWFVPILGMINLMTSFLIPIGMWGADGVGDLTFPWVATADTLHIEYGPIERIISLFILLYVSIALISVTVHWHVSFEIIRSMISIEKFTSKQSKIIDWVILSGFSVGILVLEKNLREQNIFDFGEVWLKIRLPSEVLLVVIMFALARRKGG